MPLDPEIAVLLEALSSLPALESMAVADARGLVDQLGAAAPAGSLDVESSDRTISTRGGDLPVRIYRPIQARGVLVYFHGGGWTLGNLSSVDAALRDFSAASYFTIVSVDYRLAPEHPFPAAVEDAVDATAWADTTRGDLAGIGCPLVVAGDSAGGNLAAVVAQKAVASRGPAIAGQILFYPVTSTDTNTQSYCDYAEGFFLTRSLMRWFLDNYLPNAADRTDPAAAPLLARDLTGLPPTLIQTAEFDPLREEGEAYAGQLAEAGVPVTLQRREGLIHGFVTMAGSLRGAALARDDAVAWVKDLAAMNAPRAGAAGPR